MKWFKNLKISSKLIIAFLVIALIAGVVGIVGIINLNTMNQNDANLYGVHTQGISYNAYAEMYFQKTRFNALKMTIAEDSETLDECIDKVDRYTAESDNYLSLYEGIIADNEAQSMFDEISESWAAYKTYVDKALKMVAQGDTEGAEKMLMRESAETATTLQNQFDALTAYNIEQAKEVSNSNTQAARNSTLIMIIVVAGAVILAVLMGILISRMISKPIKSIADGAAKLAKGETDIADIDYDSKDEVGQMMRAFQEVIRAIKALVTDANALVQHAVSGKLSVRTDISKHQGDYKKIVEGINQTLDAIIAPIQEAAQVLEEMAKGNLAVSVKGDYQGDHALIKNALNVTIGNINGYIIEISEILGKVAKGDLTAGIDSEYMGDFIALKDSINGILESLNEVMQEINASADQVAAGTQQVSGGSQEISQGAAEQASAIEELTTSITQIAEQTKLNAGSANEASQLTNGAKDNAEQGNEQMKAMQQAMADINESSENISKIIKVIDDIAFQTNILALNAAVEAARAGVHGKGFAVVAEEVRNLAARSANAAKETTDLIEGSIRKAEAGTKIADETAGALINIVSGVEKAAQLVGEIASASNEQASAIAQVNTGIEQMSQVVQTNSATSEEAAAASEELSSQAETLKGMVGQFQLRSGDGDGKKAEAPAEEEPAQREEPQILLSDDDFGKY